MHLFLNTKLKMNPAEKNDEVKKEVETDEEKEHRVFGI